MKITDGIMNPAAAEKEPALNVPAEVGPQAADEYTKLLVEGMTAAGVQPDVIFAFKKTGFVLTPQNEQLLSEAERRAWDEAIAEYPGERGASR